MIFQEFSQTLDNHVIFRCSKIIQEYPYYAGRIYCNNEYGYTVEENEHSCNYTWERKGEAISTEDANYDIYSFLTYDYCEILQGGSDIIKEMDITTGIPERDDGYDLNSRRTKCFTSVLSIRNVTEDDFGDYECIWGSSSRWDKSQSLDITVLDLASDEKLPTKITYFQRNFNIGLKSKVLMQCVVENGPVFWFYNTTNSESIQPLEIATESDAWNCFNHSERSHKVSNITESFIFFDNVCIFDQKYDIYCSADSEGKLLSRGKHLHDSYDDMLYDENYRYSQWSFANEMVAHISIVIPTVTILFFSIVSVFACCRGGLCGDWCSCLKSRGYTQTPIVTVNNPVCPAPDIAPVVSAASPPPSYNALPNQTDA